jgi:hypothetical protein
MDTMRAFQNNMNAQANGATMRVFDWERAACRILEIKPQEASAGLGEDWEYTGGTIYRDGEAVTDSYTYLASTWAIPELDMDGEVEECWRWMDDKCKWDADTMWPYEALRILKNK